MTARAQFRVFYAWQSDRQANHHRYFIRDALDEVAERLNSDAAVPYDIYIDQDTQGVPGLCDIPATILDKIASSDAFVADLTYVATSEPEDAEVGARCCSNPNVLFELGFAFHAIGWQRLICVLNEVHGAASEQIFDLDHRRHPITYSLPQEGKTRREVMKEFSKELESAIREIVPLGTHVPKLSEEETFRNVASQMPDLIAEMRQDVTNPETRLMREFFVLESNWVFNYKGKYLVYYLDKLDDLQSKLTLLENHGYIIDITPRKTKKYRFSEHFVKLLVSLPPVDEEAGEGD